jgi:hypothetical protein
VISGFDDTLDELDRGGLRVERISIRDMNTRVGWVVFISTRLLAPGEGVLSGFVGVTGVVYKQDQFEKP